MLELLLQPQCSWQPLSLGRDGEDSAVLAVTACSRARTGDGIGAVKWGCNRLESKCKMKSSKFSGEQPALSYSQWSLFSLTICWKDLCCFLLNTSVDLLQADAFCFTSTWHKQKMGRRIQPRSLTQHCIPSVVKPQMVLMQESPACPGLILNDPDELWLFPVANT